MDKKECIKCGNLFSTRANDYNKHVALCDGKYTPSAKRTIRNCKHCNNDFDITDKPKGWMANHSRWCESNPKRKEYISELKNTSSKSRIHLMNESRKNTGRTNQFTAARIDGRPVPESAMKNKSGTFLGKTHSDETKDKIRKKALESTHRRLKKNVIEYNGVLLDSSWELELAKRLDELGIEWIRPDPIPWTDKEGITHNYFPDFYLPEYNKYIDPKNPHAAEVQKEKLKVLLEQYDNIVILDSIEKCKNFVI